MAVNLVSLVTQFLTPDVIARIASTLGLESTTVQKAISGSIPAILAGLAGVAVKPEGAQQLSGAVAQQSPTVLDNLTSVIGGAGQRAFADGGSSMLSKLLGGGTMNALTGAIGEFAGVSKTATGSLLGMLGPVVLGALGRQQRSAGLDASGLASLLASQKDQIAAAIPSGLANQLGGTGLLDMVDSGMRRSAAAAGRLGSAAEHTIAGAGQSAYPMGNAAAGRAGNAASAFWPLVLLGIAVLAGLAWYFFPSDSGEIVAEQTQPSAVQPIPQPRIAATQSPDQPAGTVGLATPLVVGGVNLANQVNASVGALRTALAGITDVTSAQDALPRIRDAKAQLDRVSTLAEQLPPEGRRSLARLIAGVLPAINGLCDKVLAMPGVASVARPTIDELRARLDSLATA